MVLTRATIDPARTASSAHRRHHEHTNHTTPFVDQNQTYTSHPSHQVFLREYVLNAAGDPVATGRIASRSATTAASHLGRMSRRLKAQAATMLGIQLDDLDVLDCRCWRPIAYGKFIPDRGTGFAQIVLQPPRSASAGSRWRWARLGHAGDPINATLAVRTGHAFLNDIAHNAAPGTVFDTANDPASRARRRSADGDDVAGNTIAIDFAGRKAYDDELLDRHFITGDGRGNENIALTAVHHVFHSEHNRQVGEIKATLLADAPRSSATWRS